MVRRKGVILCAIVVWPTLTWFVMCIPYTRAVQDGREIQTSYGVARWFEVTAGREQTGIAALLPIKAIGKPKIYPVRATISVVITITIVVVVVIYARQRIRSLTPRWLCNRCGFVVRGGFPRATVCPECGALPHL